MLDENGKNIKQATPSIPAEIIGLSDVPNAGDEFIVINVRRRQERLRYLGKVSLEMLSWQSNKL